MKFHALLPVRDEGDIIGQCLEHLLSWADAVYVFDTGSEDQTWDIVNETAGREKRVRPIGRKPVYFSEVMVRGWMFNVARDFMTSGDWFLRVDADEFHHIPPPEFVRDRMRSYETIAYHQYYEFQLTQSEAAAWQSSTDHAAERARPIEERRRHFIVTEYSEPRLCKYRQTMRWPPSVSFPINAGYLARERLPIRHYPHRDPEQLRRRCALRAIMMGSKENNRHWSLPALHHWSQPEWQKFVVSDDNSNLRFWTPGTALPFYSFDNHLARQPKRLMQRLAHSFLLPVLDRCRPEWPPNAGPLLIEDHLVARLSRELRA
jgi:glycosyltransferase involved in cell wall biosynthesis